MFNRTWPAILPLFLPTCLLQFGAGHIYFSSLKLITCYGWRPMDHTMDSNSSYVFLGLSPVPRASITNSLGFFKVRVRVRVRVKGYG